MSSNPVANYDTHEHFFKYVNIDVTLNEFIWRADTGFMANQINNMLQKRYPLKAVSNVTNRGVYVNFYDTNGVDLWHISFHLEKIANKTGPGAIHLKNSKGNYQLIYITHTPNVCLPYFTNSLKLHRGSFVKHSLQICSMYEPTIQIVLDLLNEYFTPPTNPLSLYKPLSGMTQKHPYLLTVMASRPSNVAVSGLIGGKTRSNRSKSKLARTYKHKA